MFRIWIVSVGELGDLIMIIGQSVDLAGRSMRVAPAVMT